MNGEPAILEIQPKREATISVAEKKLLDEAERKKIFLYGRELKEREEVHERIIEIAKKLGEKYPEARQCYLFHTLVGSTPPDTCSIFDFPGDDSIVKIMEDLYREYKGEG